MQAKTGTTDYPSVIVMGILDLGLVLTISPRIPRLVTALHTPCDVFHLIVMLIGC